VVWLPCPYLSADVELTDERVAHIRSTHPAEAQHILDGLSLVVREPESVYVRAGGEDQYLLARKVDLPTGSKHIVVIVVRQDESKRLWVITAFITRRLSGGDRWKAI
jgi:hypothetical protein